MAATRILIWLPVRLVRRSRISNMAFSPGTCSNFERASRLRAGCTAKATLSGHRTEECHRRKRRTDQGTHVEQDRRLLWVLFTNDFSEEHAALRKLAERRGFEPWIRFSGRPRSADRIRSP